MQKIQLNKYIIYGGIVGIAVIGVAIGMIGSSTLARRNHLKEIEGNIVDQGKEAHISGSLLEIKQKIDGRRHNRRRTFKAGTAVYTRFI